MIEPKVILLDDGTLDTVVSVEGIEYRYNFQNQDSPEETYKEFVDWAMADAIEQHAMNKEVAK